MSVGATVATIEPGVAKRVRGGVAVVAGAVGFLATYAVLQVLHAAGRDPRALADISSIPLFARFVAAAGCGLATGCVGATSIPVTPRALRALRALFAAAIAIFVIAVVLLP